MEPRNEYMYDYHRLGGGYEFFLDSYVVYHYDGQYYHFEDKIDGRIDLRTRYARKNLGLTNEIIHKCDKY